MPFLSSYLRAPPGLSGDATGLWYSTVYLVFGWLKYLVIFALLFFVLYLEERRGKIHGGYRSIIISLFLGGLVGIVDYTFGFWPSPFSSLGGLLFVVATIVSDTIVGALLVVFVGFTAIYLSRIRGRDAHLDEDTTSSN